MADVRTIRDDEIGARVALSAEAFGFPAAPTAEQRFRETHDLRWSFASFDADRMVAALDIEPMEVALNGRWLPMGGVQGVGAYPEVRRRGHIAALLRTALERMHEEGLAISMLFPTFYTLYRRFGWELGASDRAYRFDSHELRDANIAEAGSFERLSIDDWAALHELYRAAAPSRNGMLGRTERWWRQRVLVGRDDAPRDIVLWRDESGRPGGYIIYSRGGQQMLFELDPTRRQLAGHELTIRELIATTDAAYAQLLRFVRSHDLARRVVWTAPLDDPLLHIAPDPRSVFTEVRSSFMMRLVDLRAALVARGAPAAMPPSAFALRVRDERCTWNDGTWRIETAAGGECAVSAAQGDGDLAIDVGGLAALLTGALSVAAARATGRLVVRDERAATALAAFVATTHAPFCSDFF